MPALPACSVIACRCWWRCAVLLVFLFFTDPKIKSLTRTSCRVKGRRDERREGKRRPENFVFSREGGADGRWHDLALQLLTSSVTITARRTRHSNTQEKKEKKENIRIRQSTVHPPTGNVRGEAKQNGGGDQLLRKRQWSTALVTSTHCPSFFFGSKQQQRLQFNKQQVNKERKKKVGGGCCVRVLRNASGTESLLFYSLFFFFSLFLLLCVCGCFHRSHPLLKSRRFCCCCCSHCTDRPSVRPTEKQTK